MPSPQESCVIYCRISHDRDGEGLGVERQEEDCRALASRLGLEVLWVGVDNDIGASDRTSSNKVREAYVEMLRQARAGRFKTILAYSNSRLTRRVLEYLELIELYKQHNVVVRTVASGDHDLSTADGRGAAITVATWDAAEAERIAERVQRAMRAKAEKGLPAKQWRRPFGFMEDQITHHPVEAELIREAVRAIINGASITSIRRKWESEGVLTSDGKTEWGWTPVHRVLFSPRVVGQREHKARDKDLVLYDAAWKPIISVEERDAALAMLEKRHRTKVKEGRWLLTDLVVCGLCNRKLYGQRVDPEERSSYACNSGKSANHLAINARRLEKYVVDAVYNYVFARAYRRVSAPEPEATPDWPRESELRQIDETISELMDAVAKRTLSAQRVIPQVQKLEEEHRLLSDERRAYYEAAVARPIDNLEDAWTKSVILGSEDSSFEDKQLAIRSEVNVVVIRKADNKYASRTEEGFARRIDLVWKEPHLDVEPLTEDEWNEARMRADSDTAMIDRLWKLYPLRDQCHRLVVIQNLLREAANDAHRPISGEIHLRLRWT